MMMNRDAATVCPPSSGKSVIFLQIAVILAAGVLAILGLRTVFAGDALMSRLATVYSLTHDGSWYIDRPADQPPNPYERRTIDKVEARGRLLSSKPPVLSLFMTAEYVALHHGLGLDMDRPAHLKPIARWMVFTFVVLPYLLALAAFAGILNLLVTNPWHRLALLTGLAFGTQFTSYAAQMNNHVPAAAMMIAALYLALGLWMGKAAPRPWRFVLFGVTAALVFTIEIPMTIYPALAGIWLLWRYPRQAFFWGGLGALPILVVHFAVMTAITGNPLPVQISREPFLFESSYWRHPLGVDALNEPKLIYLFHMTLGRHGTFLLFPILLIGVAGAWLALVKRDCPYRALTLAGCAGFAMLTFYYVSGTNNYGGASYGFRWHLGSMPILLLMGVPVLETLRRRWVWGVLALLFLVSAFSMWECYRMPWGTDMEWTCRWLFGPSV